MRFEVVIAFTWIVLAAAATVLINDPACTVGCLIMAKLSIVRSGT